MMTAVYPRALPDPRQRGVVTRYGTLTAFDAAAYVGQMMADPAVAAWATAHSLNAGAMTALGTALQAAIFAGYGGAQPTSGFNHMGPLAAREAADAAHLV